MDFIVRKVLFSHGAIYTTLFILLLLILIILFVKHVSEKRFLSSFVMMIFMFPILSRIPNIFYFYVNTATWSNSKAGIGCAELIVIYFLYNIRKEEKFIEIVKFLKSSKILFLIIIASLSMAISQQFSLPTKIGFLFGFTKVLNPFFFMIIVAYIFFRYRNKLTQVVNWMIGSILFSALFTLLVIKQENTQLGFIRFGGGPIGPTTIVAAIVFTWSLISIINFMNNNQLFINIFDKSRPLFDLNKMFSFIAVGMLMTIGIYTHTRGPLIYYFIGLILIVSLAGIKRLIPFLSAIIILLVILIPVAPRIGNYVITAVNEREIPKITNLKADSSIATRMKRNRVAIELISKNPFLGIGIGNPSSGVPGNPYYNVHFHVYNTPLAWVTYGGLICGLAFLTINFKIFFLGLREAFKDKTSNSFFVKGLTVVLFCWFIDFFTTANNLLWGYPFTSVVYFYSVLGSIIGLTMKEKCMK